MCIWGNQNKCKCNIFFKLLFYKCFCDVSSSKHKFPKVLVHYNVYLDWKYANIMKHFGGKNTLGEKIDPISGMIEDLDLNEICKELERIWTKLGHNKGVPINISTCYFSKHLYSNQSFL